MIRQINIIALALAAGLACATSDLVAQKTAPEPIRPPKPVMSKSDLHRKLHGQSGHADRIDVHVKKMLSLAMELREAGFEEEAQVLMRQAKLLASKHQAKQRPHANREMFVYPKEHLERIKREAERRARGGGEVIEIEEGEPRRLQRQDDVVRTRELDRAMAEQHEMARRKKVDMARREADLNARVEHLTKQVQELRHMIQELKRAIDKRDKYERRGPISR